MKRNRILYLTAALFVIIFAVALVLYAGEGKSMTYNGWLVDQACVFSPNSIAFDGTDLKANPGLHSLKCALAPPCVASGFGISVEGDDGSYMFYKFDKKGSKLAEDTVLKKTSKSDQIMVEVTGTLRGDVIRVSIIKEM